MSKKKTSYLEKIIAKRVGASTITSIPVPTPKPNSTKKGWFFAADNNHLRYGDNRLIAVGITHTTDHTPSLCRGGLHASTTIANAIMYAPGKNLYRVSVDGVDHSDEEYSFISSYKFVGTSRTYLAHIDPSDIIDRELRACLLRHITKRKIKLEDKVIDYLHGLSEFPELVAKDLNNTDERDMLDYVWRINQAKITQEGYAKMSIYNALLQSTFYLNACNYITVDDEVLKAMNLS